MIFHLLPDTLIIHRIHINCSVTVSHKNLFQGKNHIDVSVCSSSLMQTNVYCTYICTKYEMRITYGK